MKIIPRTKLNPKAGQNFKFTFDIPMGFTLVIDTREQAPLFATGSLPKGLLVVRDTLSVGDYSVRGFESQIAVERKTIYDLLTCLGNERERFKRELEKLKDYEWRSIVLEGTEEELLQFHDFSLMHPESVRQSVVSINIRYGIQFYFSPKRSSIERWVLDHFIKFYRIKREG
uniref:Putative nuclease n=1 Tax=viral metagenome TaxID=1070528 RepID=A0A6M3LR84_9ZZZZ